MIPSHGRSLNRKNDRQLRPTTTSLALYRGLLRDPQASRNNAGR